MEFSYTFLVLRYLAEIYLYRKKSEKQKISNGELISDLQM